MKCLRDGKKSSCAAEMLWGVKRKDRGKAGKDRLGRHRAKKENRDNTEEHQLLGPAGGCS